MTQSCEEWLIPQRAGLLGSSSVEKDLRVLVDNELSMNQQCPGGQEGQWYPGVGSIHGTPGIKKSQLIHGGDLAPLLSPGEAISGMLCPVLCCVQFSIQERHGAPGAGPAEGNKDD
ncbi:hypothetical protein TURU_018725 [Turdus rufiventris]|nr:hypothetical protein TURU_018725 [Turdus rufiventris]